MMQRILKEYREERERRRAENLEKQAAEEAKKKENEEKLKEPASSEQRSGGDEEQIDFVEELGEGEERCVEHGGCSAVIPFLDDYGLADYIPPDEEDCRFSNTELAVTYAVLNAAEIAKVEQDFKLLPSYEMGGMLGKVKLPSVSLYRQRIPLIAAQMDMRDVIFESSKRMHELLSFSEVVYVDAHFMPYYGARDILHGYYPQKRLAMHGREYFFVHERDGLPVYATISDGYRKTQHYIKDVDEKLRAIYGATKKGLLEVFDRGGYSKEFCVGISETIRFICWRSDAKEVPKEIRAADWIEVRVEQQGNGYGQVKEKKLYACEIKAEFKAERKKAKFREIWISKGKKTSPALSNDFETPLEDLVQHLTRRWGAQENMFKELKDHGIDRIHSYRKEAFTEGLLYRLGLENRDQGICHEIDNPERRTSNKRISNLRVQKKRMSDRIIELEKNGKKKEALKIKRKHQALSRQITNQIEKRDALPRKVNLFERIKHKGIVRLSDEKKLFFDWLKMNAIWAKREIVEIVKPFYKDLRDVNKFVKSILNSRTYVRKSGDVLHVSFPQQRSKKAVEALAQLCATLNESNRINLGSNMKKMIFSVRGQD
ncbi:MAG: putative transposase [Spirochaetota bacterium]